MIVSRVEASGEVYPYKNEDWLRYLLPALWQADERPLILLTGPSTVRENLLVEEFASAFPGYRVVQGGISQGTLGDAMASLDYIEHVYGARALPRIIVLGLSPRFLAEIPAAGRPFAQGLELYSPYYRVRGGSPAGFGLEHKSMLEGAVARTRFVIRKQHPRYASLSAWTVARLVGPELSESLLSTQAMESPVARMFLSGRARHIGIHRYALELASPYKYRNLPAKAFAGEQLTRYIEHPNSFWKYVYAWAPAEDSGVRARIAALLEYAQEHHIEIYAVNLPEGSANRIRYQAGHADQYFTLLDSAFEAVPLLNLRCLLNDDEFHDAEHARLPGARLVTAQVIRFVRDARAARLATDGPGAGDYRGIVTPAAASHCIDPPEPEREHIEPDDSKRRRTDLATALSRSP